LDVVFATIGILHFLSLSTHSQAFGATPSILWNFGNGTDGSGPGSLIRDTTGNLYGTTFNGGAYAGVDANGNNLGGTVFKLTPPSTAGGSWTESVLWNFGNGNDGNQPDGGLIMDASGNLYGTTSHGGAYSTVDANGNPIGGTVFELTPPSTSGGLWTESILWSFANGMDGNDPNAPLIMDASGNLYGTTQQGGTHINPANGQGYGTVFELTPPSTIGAPWTESILLNFNGSDGAGPKAGLIMDSSDDLFGTTEGGGAHNGGAGGTVFELTPPSSSGGNWTESILWSFGSGLDGLDPVAGLIMDKNGNLYGTTENGGADFRVGVLGGTVFELTPPSTTGETWTELILWSFGNGPDGQLPRAGVIMDASGNLYGTTAVSGTVFELKPPSKAGESWTESILADISSSGLIRDTVGNLYGSSGGGTFGGGVAFEISIPTTLTASPTQLNFGKVDATGTSKPKKVTLTNKGKAPAVISSVTASAPFITGGGPDTCTGQTIAPKKTCSFEVEYAPTTFGEVDGGFASVEYNGTSPLVTLKGISIAATLKAPKAASFAPVSAGSLGTPKNIVISNLSTVTVTFGTAMLGGSDPGSFKISSDLCSGQPLAPKGTCGIGVESAPPGNATGTQSAMLSLEFTYGANQGNVSTNLSGKVK